MADIDDAGQKELIDGYRGKHAVASEVLPAESDEGDSERGLGTAQEQAFHPGYHLDLGGTCSGHTTRLTGYTFGDSLRSERPRAFRLIATVLEWGLHTCPARWVWTRGTTAPRTRMLDCESGIPRR
jgi:hypothetical protein